jgi:hypothetical protein
VQDRLAAARMLQEKAGPLLANSPILVSIHFSRDNHPRFSSVVEPVHAVSFTARSETLENIQILRISLRMFGANIRKNGLPQEACHLFNVFIPYF